MRGQHIHRWLEVAHARGVACQVADLPWPEDGLGLAADIMTVDEYQVVHPYLFQHLTSCPLVDSGIDMVSVEQTVYAYDSVGEVVLATKPDLMYRQGSELVIRETKSSAVANVSTRDEAYDQYSQVPFFIQMLSAGLLARHGADRGRVDVEVLTPDEQLVWSWSTDDTVTRRVAAGDVRRSAEAWHLDRTWQATPGRHCTWCPVSRWCPDRLQDGVDSMGSSAGASSKTDIDTAGTPPF
jgi:hypothetical protein